MTDRDLVSDFTLSSHWGLPLIRLALIVEKARIDQLNIKLSSPNKQENRIGMERDQSIFRAIIQKLDKKLT